MTPLQIIAIDDDNGQLDQLCTAISRHFGSMGYKAEIKRFALARMDDNALSELEAAVQLRPDVILCDNHFGEDPGLQSWGFQYLSQLKRRLPDAVVILVTRQDLTNAEFAKATPHPHIILEKTKFNNAGKRVEGGRIFDEEYVKFFRDEFMDAFGRTRIYNLAMPEDVKVAIKNLRSRVRPRSAPSEAEVRSLIEQVCFMGRSGEENAIDLVTLGKLEGGLSGSAVCTIELSDGDKVYGMPGVLKLSNRESAQREIENHSRYVKWMLPYTWRVDVIGTGHTEKFGAVCYSFAHGGSEPPVSLSTVLRMRGVTQTKDILQSVFDPGRQTWYSQRKAKDEVEDIGLFLSNRLPYFVSPNDLHAKADKFRRIVASVCRDNDLEIINQGATFLVSVGGRTIDLHNFERKIFSQNWGIPVRECIAHGDLNAGNIMVKPHGSDFAFIDFRHTGWHHLARDFCSVEGSIRTLFQRAASNKNFVEYFQRELARQATEARLFSQGSSSPMARLQEIETYQQSCALNIDSDDGDRELISILRCLYHRNFTDSYFKEYCLAMFAHSWWLTCFDTTWAPSQREVLVAEVLALLCFLWPEAISREAD